MKKVITLVALLATLTALPAKSSTQQPQAVTPDSTLQGHNGNDNENDLSFTTAFPKPFYKTSYFGLALTGATVVVAGAFTYFTAGAGAPVAATGVSTAASLIGGGGAGSYMAGLSTVGGWFGGNAILGSAILNGISIGVTGGGASFAALSAIGKAGVLASVTASALDGVFVSQNPETKNLSYRVRLTIPAELGSKEVRAITMSLDKVESSLLDKKVREDDVKYSGELKEREVILKSSLERAKTAYRSGAGNEDLIVLAVLAKIAGRPDLFKQLIHRVQAEKLKDSGYLDYLKAVESVERGDLATSKNLLRKSKWQNPYAIEPALLLINVLSHEGFIAHEQEILGIAEIAREDFNSNKYEASYSMASIDYRMGTLFLNRKDYIRAHEYYKNAYEELAFLQKFLGNQSMKNTIRIGMANALFGQGKKDDAKVLFEKVLSDCKDDDEKSFFTTQYAGTV